MRTLSRTLFALAALAVVPHSLLAVDVVVRRDGQRDGGKIGQVSKAEVTLTKQVGGELTIAVNEINFIEWDGAPPELALGRGALNGGQLDAAQKNLEQAAQSAAGSDNDGMRGDIDYLLGRVLAEKALADPKQTAAASQKLQAFISGHRDHYRTFDAQLLLGNVSLEAGDYAAAVAAFAAAGSAPWKDYQMASQNGQGRVLLAQNNVDGAKREFDAVAAVTPDGDAQKSQRLEALVGQARCLQLQKQWQPAIDILDQVIDQATAGDTRLQAEAYVLQGDCLVGNGANAKEAIMAYLHVDVIPALSKEPDLHAEALYYLSRLWKQIGQEQRGSDAAEALRSQYGESDWAKKLGG